MFGLNKNPSIAPIVVAFLLLLPGVPAASPYKILVVMSYEIDFPWCGDISEGIESVVAGAGEIRYFYMDTKKDLAGGEKKAKEAYDLFLAYQPDGVIASDDNAQSMFVVPFLKDKVKTPVMFCGVNAAPEKYGYPASNVSGMLERPHFNESVAFAQQLIPSIKTFGFIIKDSPTGQAHLSQIQREAGSYSARLSDFKTPKTLSELVEMTKALKAESDVLFVAALAGVLDDQGAPLTEKESVKIALTHFGAKPSIGAEEYIVRYGALCSVVRTGQEQGQTATRMLLRAMQGTLVREIPIQRNQKGKRIINATTMKALGITPRPEILRGAELVRTEE